jgi:hypothetical protein
MESGKYRIKNLGGGEALQHMHQKEGITKALGKFCKSAFAKYLINNKEEKKCHENSSKFGIFSN